MQNKADNQPKLLRATMDPDTDWLVCPYCGFTRSSYSPTAREVMCFKCGQDYLSPNAQSSTDETETYSTGEGNEGSTPSIPVNISSDQSQHISSVSGDTIKRSIKGAKQDVSIPADEVEQFTDEQRKAQYWLADYLYLDVTTLWMYAPKDGLTGAAVSSLLKKVEAILNGNNDAYTRQLAVNRAASARSTQQAVVEALERLIRASILLNTVEVVGIADLKEAIARAEAGNAKA